MKNKLYRIYLGLRTKLEGGFSNIEVHDIDHNDAPEFCDAYIGDADWARTGKPLSQEALDWLNEDSDFVHQQVQDAIY